MKKKDKIKAAAQLPTGDYVVFVIHRKGSSETVAAQTPFNPAFRATSARRSHGPSHDLGLHVPKSIVHRHNEAITSIRCVE